MTVRPGGGAPERRRWTLVRAGSDAMPSSVRRFMRRARRRRLRAALPWAVGVGFLSVLGLLAWVILGSSLLGVRTVAVDGTSLLGPDEVRAAAAVPAGAPLARLDLEAVAARVSTLPAVEKATVTRQWPDALTVVVVERTAEAVVPQGRRFLVVDRFGVVFQDLNRRPAHLPLVRIADPRGNVDGTRGAVGVIASLSQSLRRQLLEVGVAGPAQITLKLSGGRTVVWGDASRSTEKATVTAGLLQRDGKTFDVSDPGVVTIR
ncbi:cell division protein FtsQ [Asanoa ishikariensis]|uniref:Cell division protein FtsQ n=1 Tax=Asanoa ishikariensis TaxID=137265 RepID=A0A1H3P6X4_9ACTN|nr:FtsQ-type POTRA domain-containing protein [Asanoa ishikariensis]GIF68063.1 cell division protein FtsQ [Asanoa ishikariensis]SDY96838.1 cell division protein FtsQ [Asanoa ishikariensis]